VQGRTIASGPLDYYLQATEPNGTNHTFLTSHAFASEQLDRLTFQTLSNTNSAVDLRFSQPHGTGWTVDRNNIATREYASHLKAATYDLASLAEAINTKVHTLTQQINEVAEEAIGSMIANDALRCAAGYAATVIGSSRPCLFQLAPNMPHGTSLDMQFGVDGRCTLRAEASAQGTNSAITLDIALRYDENTGYPAIVDVHIEGASNTEALLQPLIDTLREQRRVLELDELGIRPQGLLSRAKRFGKRILSHLGFTR
jgi:hypothetical protein